MTMTVGEGDSAHAHRAPWRELPDGPFRLEVDDLVVYGRKEGSGPLLILQNGMWIDTFESLLLPFFKALTSHFTVLTFDPRGQGRTSLGRGQISYARFAADTVRLMDKLGIEAAHFIGHSDGGCIQLNLMLDFPERVRSATLVGTPHDHAAYTEGGTAMMNAWYEEMTRGEETSIAAGLANYEATYSQISPEPGRLRETVVGRRNCWATEPNISVRQLGRIQRPVLVVVAGKDEFIRPEGFDNLVRSIPSARTVTFADMTHTLTPHVDEIAIATADFVASL
jgi:pimeloyl-ACP methyl ester carboxylesterase